MIHSEPNGAARPVWQWREEIRKAPVPPLTKLVCYAIGDYFSADNIDQGAFPGVQRLCDETGINNRSLATHLTNAEQAGLLAIERRDPRRPWQPIRAAISSQVKEVHVGPANSSA